MMNQAEMYMRRALELAALAREWVSPNPMVGCVIVHEGLIIGEGFHQKYGGPHAEVNAVADVKDQSLLSESTVFVSLEPCSHFGKTPPCADLLVNLNVKKVVICNLDPNPLVSGRGVKRLREAGIEVETGILEKEGEWLNRRFFKAMRMKMPYIIIKWAETADGFVAAKDGSPVKISNSVVDFNVHRWRAEEDAILVGFNTVINDNPQLTNRLWPEGKNPVRVIIDQALELSLENKIFDESAPTLILNSIKNQKEGHPDYLKIEGDFLQNAMLALAQKGIHSILVEGGPKTINSFFEAGLYDEIRVIKSHLILGEGIAAPHVPAGIPFRKEEKLLDNKIFYYY